MCFAAEKEGRTKMKRSCLSPRATTKSNAVDVSLSSLCYLKGCLQFILSQHSGPEMVDHSTVPVRPSELVI
ncbi:hypothetical protein NC651_000558 [Populus alba x Populus x berolinensis]|nr:hypothetical protein NC651_000558 [Populus alba x Populus x berolinensis]